MEIANASPLLTRDRILTLLQQGAKAAPANEYEQLMEIYCVAKAGGIATQIAVAQRLEDTETAKLLTEIKTLSAQPGMAGRVQALQQEIEDLKISVANRIQYLTKLDPQAMAAVQSCLPEMDAHFAAQRQL